MKSTTKIPLIGFLIALVLVTVAGLIWFYMGAQKKTQIEPPTKTIMDFMTALQKRDARKVFDASSALGPKLKQVFAESASVGGKSSESMMEETFQHWEEKFKMPTANDGAGMPLERNLVTPESKLDVTQVDEYQAEIHGKVQGQNTIDLVKRTEKKGEDELVYIRVEFPDKAKAPKCGDVPNCLRNKTARIKSAVLQIECTIFPDSPDYYRNHKWFEDHEKSMGNLPGWTTARDYYLGGGKWSYAVSPYLDWQKVVFFR